MISIGKDAAKKRLARELVDEVLAECMTCGEAADYQIHIPASKCHKCFKPEEHHTYRPRGDEA